MFKSIAAAALILVACTAAVGLLAVALTSGVSGAYILAGIIAAGIAVVSL